MTEPYRFDLVIKGGEIVLSDQVIQGDIGIKDGIIACIADRIANDTYGAVIDASGQTVIPGMMDVHVHLNEPGLDDWEGFPSGSAALAAGGCTSYFDMPLNGLPPTTAVEYLKQKARLAQGRSVLDYAFWGGLVPGNLEQLAPLSEAGVIGFKAFMSAAGGKEENAFREVDDLALYQGMREIARLGKILALHAESEAVIAALAGDLIKQGRTSAEDYLASRPPYAELEAVRRALFFAAQTGCSLHFVHISTPASVEAIRDARNNGMDVTLEMCPHYLVLGEESLAGVGPLAKCAPPLRSRQEQEGLWRALERGEIDMISSDHSPCPPDMKLTSDWFQLWGGISGAQSSVELMLGEGHIRRGIPLPLLCRMMSTNPARRFGLHPAKGEIAVGTDADLTLVDMTAPYVLKKEQLFDRHRMSVYEGMEMKCKIIKTLLRGSVVYDRRRGVSGTNSGLWMRHIR